MLIQVSDWTFDVDISGTMHYSANVWNDHCTCGYCRNFYATMDDSYPQVKSFLEKFGMNSLTPEEMMPIEPTLCTASYCISGRILHRGVQLIDLDGICFEVIPGERTDYETGCPSPFFVLRTGFLDLPWVLDEDMDDVISPANEPEYLQRMMDRLLENADEEQVLS